MQEWQYIDADTWTSFQNEDKLAFATICQLYHPRLYTYGCSFIRNPQIVEDCIQKSFAAFWQNRHQLQSVTAIQSYLFATFRSRLLKALPKRINFFYGRSFTVQLSADQVMVDAGQLYEQHIDLYRSVRQLTGRQKEALLLKFYLNLSYHEVAEVLNSSIKTTYKLVTKTMTQLWKGYSRQLCNSRHVANQFIADDYFLQWARFPDANGNTFWKAWITANPAKKDELQAALQFVQSLQFTVAEPSKQQIEQSLFITLSAIAGQQTKKPFMKHTNKKWWKLFLILLMCSCSPRLASHSNNTVTVMSYNVHHANPPSQPDVIDLEAIAKVINEQHPDVVALQELDVNTKRSGLGLNEAAALGKLTGMHHFFGKTIPYDGGEYGIGILSKFPITNTDLTMLPNISGEPRGLATVLVTLPNRKQFVFACTHLDAQRVDTNRVLQINAIINILSKEKLPVLIAGDFNSEPSSRVIQKLDAYFTRTCIDNCGFTIPEKNPTKTIDFIGYMPKHAFEVQEHKVIDEQYASDHLPVRAVLRIK